MNRFFVISAILLLNACATSPQREAPRIDSTSAESFHTSWQKLSADLTPTQKSQLNMAVLRIGLSDVKSAADMPVQQSITPDSIRGKVNGLSFSEILQLAEQSPTKIVQ